MLIEIEFYKGDTVLYGPSIPYRKFKEQIDFIESLYDRENDNFVPLLCRIYGWEIVDEIFSDEKITYTYDRDTEMIIVNRR